MDSMIIAIRDDRMKERAGVRRYYLVGHWKSRVGWLRVFGEVTGSYEVNHTRVSMAICFPEWRMFHTWVERVGIM
jgi:hypothetical protein